MPISSTNNTENFDSTSWDSIRAMIALINKLGTILSGTTVGGAFIVFDLTQYKDDEHKVDYDILHTRVFQSDGWVRHNYYDPKDYTVEETFEKEDD